MKNKLPKIFSIAIGILVLSFLAYSQAKQAGSIQGYVTDAEGIPLPGVTVTVESPDLIGGAQSLVTGANGFYKFQALSIGVYKVTAKLSGFNTMVNEGLVIHTGMSLSADFKMIQATVEEEVIVIGDRPTLDTKTSQPRAAVFSDELLLALPGKQGFTGLINLAPGVEYWSAYGSGYSSPNAWLFDGMDASSPFWGGSSWFKTDDNVIKEVAVMGLGLPAEYGHFTGAVINVISKSGTNKFSMLHEFRYRGKGWNSDNRGSVPVDVWYNPAMATQKWEATEYFDLALQFGGKIIQDKFWFFISGRYDRSKQIILGTTSPRTDTTKQVFAKLSFHLNKSNKFNLATDLIDNIAKGGGSPLYPPGVGRENFFPSTYINVNWTSIFSPTTFMDFKFGYHWFGSKQLPIGGLEGATPGGTDICTGLPVGNVNTYSESEGTVYHGIVHFSHFIPEFIKGSHGFKLGAEIDKAKILTAGGCPGDEQWTYCWGVPTRYIYYPPYERDTYNTMISAYLQDQWTITKRLTINIGGRYDHYSYRFPQAERGVVYKNSAISPRIGLTYDLLGDRKNVVKIHYGHYFEESQRNQFSYFETRSPDWIEYLFDEDGVPYENSRMVPGAIRQVTSQELTHPYIRELSGGFERELFRDATLAVNLYWRTIGATFGITNTAAQYAPYNLINPGPDGKVGTADDIGPMDGWQCLNPGVEAFEFLNPKKGNPGWLVEDPDWNSRGIELIFTKKFSNRWQMIASYNYMRSKGNTSGAMWSVSEPNRLQHGEMGTTVQPHLFRLQGSAILPLDINVGVIAEAKSGNDMTPYFRPVIPGIRYPWIYLSPRGRDKGRARYNIDLKVQKLFNIMGGRIEIYADVYNLLNNYDDVGIYYMYGPLFGKRTSIKTPRNFILGFRIVY